LRKEEKAEGKKTTCAGLKQQQQAASHGRPSKYDATDLAGKRKHLNKKGGLASGLA